MTNRKSHISFPLTPRSITLDDHELLGWSYLANVVDVHLSRYDHELLLLKIIKINVKKIFWGGAQPLPRPIPSGEGDTLSPHPTPFRPLALFIATGLLVSGPRPSPTPTGLLVSGLRPCPTPTGLIVRACGPPRPHWLDGIGPSALPIPTGLLVSGLVAIVR